ncbi:hypothetical protein LOZ12_006578 [Ophidiomyces ophidiicola]|uniref:Uncharacterized protein n=1 Tax=Ophidiomyces ophidiicola TaxID=1387563 RepID=A0ACB8UN71_9EURO|nr:uncharacterized protein LOZ57_006901 [Ophidiomyces ophidiicola]KAI1906142.1 hypothetical protein LOZ61_006815 [Ophidiomyces ophidiicola]KAI1920174.1 hypothetical protein LOZ60_006652 [Ophidiomyces ophidiicola]KAI1932772.1 hypothetical protein LOZ62_006566 [Ophidiomyces ophidiicola]KAI1935327.1 hypothetical protein LOZ57_006901 [Ophidiomyces ophidiicola]KAI1945859.1 hypothetical protein LOZ59_006858 [Ophidiomyces ophidiicola]
MVQTEDCILKYDLEYHAALDFIAGTMVGENCRLLRVSRIIGEHERNMLSFDILNTVTCWRKLALQLRNSSQHLLLARSTISQLQTMFHSIYRDLRISQSKTRILQAKVAGMANPHGPVASSGSASFHLHQGIKDTETEGQHLTHAVDYPHHKKRQDDFEVHANCLLKQPSCHVLEQRRVQSNSAIEKRIQDNNQFEDPEIKQSGRVENSHSGFYPRLLRPPGESCAVQQESTDDMEPQDSVPLQSRIVIATPGAVRAGIVCGIDSVALGNKSSFSVTPFLGRSDSHGKIPSLTSDDSADSSTSQPPGIWMRKPTFRATDINSRSDVHVGSSAYSGRTGQIGERNITGKRDETLLSSQKTQRTRVSRLEPINGGQLCDGFNQGGIIVKKQRVFKLKRGTNLVDPGVDGIGDTAQPQYAADRRVAPVQFSPLKRARHKYREQ